MSGKWSVIIFAVFVLIGSNAISSTTAAQVVGPSLPSPTAEAVDPSERYADVAAGQRDGYIVLSHPGEPEDLAILCIDGKLQSGVVWDPDIADVALEKLPVGISCELNSLRMAFPGADWVVNVDPLAGWTFQTAVGEYPEVLAECHEGLLFNIRASTDGATERMVDPRSQKCDSIPAGVL
jgi:hypothetical protein